MNGRPLIQMSPPMLTSTLPSRQASDLLPSLLPTRTTLPVAIHTPSPSQIQGTPCYSSHTSQCHQVQQESSPLQMVVSHHQFDTARVDLTSPASHHHQCQPISRANKPRLSSHSTAHRSAILNRARGNSRRSTPPHRLALSLQHPSPSLSRNPFPALWEEWA